MDNLEKQLNNLPKARLSKKADLRIRIGIFMIKMNRQAKTAKQPIGLRAGFVRAIAVFALLAIIISVPAYAYASPQVTRENILYPLKKGIEKAQIMLSFSPASKAKTYTRISQRRLEEASYISGKSVDFENEMNQTINEAMEYNEEAMIEAEKLDDSGSSSEIIQYVKNIKESNTSVISRIALSKGVRTDDRTMGTLVRAFDAFDTKQKLPVNNDISTSTINNSTPAMASSTPGSEDASKKEKKSIIQKIKEQIGIDRKAIDVKKKKTINPDIKNPDNKPQAGQRVSTTTEEGADARQQFEASLKAVKENFEKIKSEMKQGDFNQEEADYLIGRINAKIKKIEELIKEKNYDGLGQLLSEARAMTDYGEYFINHMKNDPKTQNPKNDPGNGLPDTGNRQINRNK